MNFKWLPLLAIAALLLTRLPPSSMVVASDDLDDTVDGEEVAEEDDIAVDEDLEEEEESDIDDLELGPAKDINVTAIFPDFPTMEIPAGAIVTAVIGLDNNADEAVVVNSIQGAIGSPQDYSQSFQNFTEMPVELRVDAGQQATFSYRFRPSERFEPRDFALSVVVNLKDKDDGMYVNTAFNQTIALTDAESDGAKTLFGYVAFASLAALAYFYNQKPKTARTKKASKSQVETGTAMKQQDEWLQGTNVVNQARRRKTSERGGKK